LLQSPSQCTSEKLTADHFARFFRGKVDSIRTSTTSADPPTIATRQVPPLGCFKPATVTEIASLLKKAPAKSCELDPIPTWLLKDLAPLIAPTICCLCNLSMDSSVVPAQLKQARVLPLLKKPTLVPDDASSYRPISNLPYLSKRVVVSRFSEYSTISTFCQPSSPHTDPFIRLKQLCCQSTMTLFAPSTVEKCLFLFSWISVRLSTP